MEKGHMSGDLGGVQSRTAVPMDTLTVLVPHRHYGVGKQLLQIFVQGVSGGNLG